MEYSTQLVSQPLPPPTQWLRGWMGGSHWLTHWLPWDAFSHWVSQWVWGGGWVCGREYYFREYYLFVPVLLVCTGGGWVDGREYYFREYYLFVPVRDGPFYFWGGAWKRGGLTIFLFENDLAHNFFSPKSSRPLPKNKMVHP